MIIRKNWFTPAFLMGLVFLFLSIKGTDIVQVEVWSLEINLPGYVVQIKELSIYFSSLILFAILLHLAFNAKGKKISTNGTEIAFLFFSIILLFITRGAIGADSGEKQKWLLSFFFNCLAFFIALRLMCFDDIESTWKTLKTMLKSWALIFSIANIFIYIGGYGFTEDGVRFYGISGHPNFLGVCLAECFLIISIEKFKNPRYEILRYVLLLFICTMLFLAGSRTSWVMALFGIFFFLGLTNKLRFSSILIIAIAAIIFLFFGNEIYSSLIGAAGNYEQRLTENTRQEAWDFLIWEWQDNPIFGAGRLSWATENSVLKSLAFGGIIIGIPFLIFHLWSVFLIYKYHKNMKFKSNSIVFNEAFGLTILFSLFIGALFEGYLIELSGIWVLTLYSLLIILGRSTAKFNNR